MTQSTADRVRRAAAAGDAAAFGVIADDYLPRAWRIALGILGG